MEKKTNSPQRSLFVGVVVLIFLTALSFNTFSPKEEDVDYAKNPTLVDRIKAKTTCTDKNNCLTKARHAYVLGQAFLKVKHAKPANLFHGYHALLHSKVYLKKGGISHYPKDLAKLDNEITTAKQELVKLFKGHYFNYTKSQQKYKYTQMARSLSAIKTHFPNQDSREYQWASGKERVMKRDGIYPSPNNR